MKILIANCPYSDIPRLAKEGKIKVGTKVKACEDSEKYINGFGGTMPSGSIGKITVIEDERFYISVNGFGNWSYFCAEFFLDILSDEEEEGKLDTDDVCSMCGLDDIFCGDTEYNDEWYCNGCESYTSRIARSDFNPKPLSFDEPLTKEAVGRWVIDRYHNRRRIIEIALSGKAFRTSLEDGTEAVWTREEAEEKGFAFTTPPEHPDEISIEEAEKLTGKKIKR